MRHKSSISPRELTSKINHCEYFSELLFILTNKEYSTQFDYIHVAAFFCTWANLWKTAHQEIRSKIDPKTRSEYQAEIKSMKDHLEGENFSLLVQFFNKIRPDYQARELSNIANAISHFPASPLRVELLLEIVRCANSIPLKSYDSQSLANLANAMAKLAPNNKYCKKTMGEIAVHVGVSSLKTYLPQDSASLANAMARISPDDKDCRTAMSKIAQHIGGESSLKTYHSQGLTNLANAMARIAPDDKDCRTAIIYIAQYVKRITLETYNSQSLANLANAMAKLTPNDNDCRETMRQIARHVRRSSLETYQPRHIANLANAMVRMASDDDKDCRTTMIYIAQYVNRVTLETYTSQSLANLANAMAKLAPNNEYCKKTMSKIAGHVGVSSLKSYQPQNLANLANAMARIAPDDKDCRTTMIYIAQYVNGVTLETYTSQSLANLANAMAKISPADKDCKATMIHIAQYVKKSSLETYNSQHLANLANAMARISPDNKYCGAAMIHIAQYVKENSLGTYPPQELANLANAMARLSPDDKDCEEAMSQIARHVRGSSLKTFKCQDLANLAHAIARMKIRQDDFSKYLSQGLMAFDLTELDIIQVSQIYSFYLYINSKGLGEIFKPTYVQQCQNELNKRLAPGTKSILQQQVAAGVRKFFSPHDSYQILEECLAACSRIDVALIHKGVEKNSKIAAIQVDGPSHFKPSTQLLNYQTLFNTELLGYEGWPIVLRIPYFQIAPDGKFNQKALEDILNKNFGKLLEKKPESELEKKNIPAPIKRLPKFALEQPLPRTKTEEKFTHRLNPKAAPFTPQGQLRPRR
jgi:hypothetical protein